MIRNALIIENTLKKGFKQNSEVEFDDILFFDCIFEKHNKLWKLIFDNSVDEYFVN